MKSHAFSHSPHLDGSYRSYGFLIGLRIQYGRARGQMFDRSLSIPTGLRIHRRLNCIRGPASLAERDDSCPYQDVLSKNKQRLLQES